MSAQPQAGHLARRGLVYVRQSTIAQTRFNTESLERQYELVDRAVALGWPREAVRVIDADLGLSGAEATEREGFKAVVAEVALGEVGIVLGIEVSRLARNNSDWYQLLDLCSLCDTLIADADGVYDPADYSDRMLLGLKGQMSEAELHLLRGRLTAGIRHKAAKGELRLVLPAGLERDPDGSVVLSPDESQRKVIGEVFRRFEELGSARQVTVSLIDDGLSLPRRRSGGRIEWCPASYQPVHGILTNPAYAGAFAYGRSRVERGGPASGHKRQLRRLEPEEWRVLIKEHHESYISFEQYQANITRLRANGPVPAGGASKAAREGSALLQGLVRCGRCGRMMQSTYRVSKRSADSARYRCQPKAGMVNGGVRCQSMMHARLVDAAVLGEVLRVLEPAALEASAQAIEAAQADDAGRLSVFVTAVERARFEAERARRQFDAIEPENRLVARSLEAAWEKRLVALHHAEAALEAQRERRPPKLLTEELDWLKNAGADLEAVLAAPTTTNRDRKALIRTLVTEVGLTADPETRKAAVVIVWRGGERSTLAVEMQRPGANYRVAAEETIDLVRRLALLYGDTMIATILARQRRSTVTGLPFTRQRVADLRRANDIPPFSPPSDTTPGHDEVVSVNTAASELGVSPETIYRWLASGFIAGEQVTGGAPWRIRIDEAVRSKVTEQAPEGWLPLADAARALGVARQTVLHKVQRGDLRAVHVRRGRRSGLRIEVKRDQLGLFDGPDDEEVRC